MALRHSAAASSAIRWRLVTRMTRGAFLRCDTDIAQLREAAIKERRKTHDIVLEGFEFALRKRGRWLPVTAI